LQSELVTPKTRPLCPTTSEQLGLVISQKAKA